MQFLRSLFIFSLLLLCFTTVFSQTKRRVKPVDDIDSVMQKMSLREKICQLIIIDVYSNRNSKYYDEVDKMLEEYPVGGLIFFQGTAPKQVELTNRWQTKTKIPMLISIDGEWGVGMRMYDVLNLPRFMTLAAAGDTALAFRYGQIIGRQCKRMGIHIDYAPVVDVNSNPKNPVINSRALSDSPAMVIKFASAVLDGMCDYGIAGVAKHFPGHGNTDVDSHRDLPVICDPLAVTDSVHLKPFKEMLKKNIFGVMVAHVQMPEFEKDSTRPASLSKALISGVLRKTMGYEGFIFTDALGMSGVTKNFKPGRIEVEALLAGIDFLLMPADVKKAVDSIEKAVDKKIIAEKDIDFRVRKILTYKKQCGILKKYIPVAPLASVDSMNAEVMKFRESLYVRSTTLLKNDGNILPLINKGQRIAVLSFNTDSMSPFNRLAQNEIKADFFYVKNVKDSVLWPRLEDTLKPYRLVIVNLLGMTQVARQNYNLSAPFAGFIDSLALRTKVILNIFGNPFVIASLKNVRSIAAITTSYERDSVAERMLAERFFGFSTFEGHLPMAVNDDFRRGCGVKTKVIPQLAYELSADPFLGQVDSIVLEAIRDSAFPACQVLCAHEGKIIYHKSFGTFKYDKKQKSRLDDLYDLASVTKVMTTTLAVMKLYDEGRIDLQMPLERYLPIVRGTPVGKVPVDRLLTHSGGLKPFIPFHNTFNPKLTPEMFSKKRSKEFPYEVADSLYSSADMREKIIKQIAKSPITANQGYKYSDLGFILLRYAVEHITGCPFEVYLDSVFYRPLGLNNIGYNPLERFPKTRIVPTENDTLFRSEWLQGHVHDQTAALQGGISGHAGLFSDGRCLAVILQMLLQNGEYADVRYFKPLTVARFTEQYFDKNRRALGFDRPIPNSSGSPACAEASMRSYGHYGFTGIMVWNDPQYHLSYIFLSNRVCPDAENRKLMEKNVRTKVQSIFYQYISKKI